MAYISEICLPPRPAVSVLMLSDKLLTLAEEADHAGMRVAAEHLLYLAHYVLEEPED